MKKYNRLLFIGFLLLLGAVAMPVFSQVSNDNEDEVYKVDANFSRGAFVPGQVLVKFKDESTIQVQRNSQGKYRAANISSVDKLLREFKVDYMEKLFPAAEAKPKAKLRKKVSPNGTIVQEKNLDKVFLVKINTLRADSTLQLIERMKEIPDVEYAEPNYYVFITSDMERTMPDIVTTPEPQIKKAPAAVETTANVICSKPSNNPLYFRQYGITQQNIHQLWNKPIINTKRPVIAILDTGVDITHPDLAANIWTNTAEAEGETAYDDDANEIVDDVHGWNFVDDYYDLTDRNGHGTHCAGIAAAVDNNIGIVGANPLAFIMPVKVMSDRGVGDIATISRGIIYAANNGADVINMSFGSPSLSYTEKEALDYAYQTSILVASAGNYGVHIYCSDPPGTIYPAAYYLVLGVMASASNLQRASYSNYDPDGPIYSEDGIDDRNYEIMVPGDKIYSTLPNGSYNQLSGTSMSAPLLAGAISALQMVKDYPSKDVLYGDLIHLQANFAAIYSDETPRIPMIDLVSLNIDDNVEGNTNIDGQVDVGETIKFSPVLRNTWADATDINLKLTVDPLYADFVEIENPEVAFGHSLSAYGRAEAMTPIKVGFANNIGDNTRIKFTLEISYAENSESFVLDVYVTVNNKCILSGIISNNTVLTADKVWYWNKLYLPEGVTLTIEPGTKIVTNLNFQEQSQILGNIICQGTPEAPIVFDYSGTKGLGHFFREVNYCYFKNVSDTPGAYYNGFCLDMANFDSDKKNHVFNHCRFDELSLDYHPTGDDHYSLNHCTVYNDPQVDYYSSHIDIQNSNMTGGISFKANILPNIQYSNFISRYPLSAQYPLAFLSDINETLQLPDNLYFGTSSEDILRNKSFCYPEYGWGVIDYSNMCTTPFSEAHGIVWKVCVNGKDAQDEYENLDPLGVGKHKFEVYFNRPMNKLVAPKISFGVREPYTQHAVSEEGEDSGWNEAGTIYTAYFTITGKTMSDGVNRIYVRGAEDNEFFEIPYEKTRFNINIQAAGSMATGFMGEAGLGKVTLTWNNENNDFDDAMGFNVYRYTASPDPSHEGEMIYDTVCVNREILDIESTEYIDYDVVPGETYYYFYKVLSTDLQEYDISNVVSVTPQTGELGDANGSGDVDVADVITTVNYAAGMEPKPFIFEAADMNSDQMIDILDVIGIIQKIINPNATAPVMIENVATYTIEDGVVYVESPVALAGVQVQLSLPPSPSPTGEGCFAVAPDLDGFEHTSAWLSDQDYLFLAYNMNGTTLSPGKHALLYIGDAEIASIRLSDAMGRNVQTVQGETTGIEQVQTGASTMMGIYNLHGQRVAVKADQLQLLPKGVYIVDGKKVIKWK